jgi:hypothetical protein
MVKDALCLSHHSRRSRSYSTRLRGCPLASKGACQPTPAQWATGSTAHCDHVSEPEIEVEQSPPAAQATRWMTMGVAGIGSASLLADVGHEVPTALLPSLLTSTLSAPAAALGLIEGISDGAAGAARFVGGALADEPHRRRSTAVGGYATTAALSSLIGTATNAIQVGMLRTGA